jgi:CheY-like chemotaxis protein
VTRLEDSDREIDLILSDKNLPAMSGLDLLHDIREKERAEQTLRGFVLVTGYPSRDSALTVLAEGGDGYMIKPFRSLVHAVEEVQRVLDAPLARWREAHRLARALESVLSGTAEQAPEGTTAAILLDEDDLASRTRACLEKAGVEVVAVDASPAPRALIAGRVEDLLAFAKDNPGSARVLADGGVSFNDVVSLVQSGGGAVYDPALVPA